jgi:alkaline phosphatase D
LKGLGSSPFAAGLSEGAVRLNNPHIKFFNSGQHGYSTVELNREYCEWVAYAVDKDHPSDTTRQPLARFRKMLEMPGLIELAV